MSFFDALKSEVCVLPFFTRLLRVINDGQMDASEEVDDAFPDALKEPILRKVQFSTISRIDNLGQ